MAIPVITALIVPGGGLGVEPQDFYVQTLVASYGAGPGPITTYVFRPHQRSLPSAWTDPNVLRIDETWAWQYNPNLIGQDQLPVGKQVYDLVQSQRPPEQVQLHSWTFSYNLNLIGRDQLPVGEQVYALPPIAAEPSPRRSWEWRYNLNLIGQDQLPIGEIVTGLPSQPDRLLQPCLQPFNINLFGQVQVPFNQTYWPLTPAAAQPDRTIAVSYNLNLIGQDQLIVGKQVYDLVPRPYPEPATRTWTWWYNLNLIGKDKLPVGEVVYDLTPIAQPQILPRSWTWSYNLNLIGQDRLPVGEQVTDLPPRAPQQPIPIFTATYNKNLIGQDQLPVGDRVTDLSPQPPLSAIQLRTWINSLNLALVTTPAQLPFNQYYWPLNPGPQQPIQIFTASYNKNLIGQDKLPVGEIVTDLPPRAPQQPTPIFVASFNKNLIGKDKLPFRQQDWPNPRGYEYPINLRSNIFVPQLTPPPPVGVRPINQYDWPTPRGPWDGMDRTIAARSQFLEPFNPIPPPPSNMPNIEHTMVRDWWDRDEWGNFYPGSGIRRG